MTNNSSGSDATLARLTSLPAWYLSLIAVVCGSLVMVIEVLGSRVIGPFFGVSLFIWTSLIAVTLVSLALGYWLGGLLSERESRVDLLHGVIAGAGVAALLVPLLKRLVLAGTLGFGLRGGAFVSSLVLFGPALLLLGCVSPLLLKIASRDLATIGRTAGRLYALSTLGSVAGTVVTGFFLLAWAGVDRIFFLTGSLLLLLGLSWFARRVRAVFLLLALLPAVAFGMERAAQPRTMASGAQTLHREDTFYGTLRVVDRKEGSIHQRTLLIDGQDQGSVDMNTRLPLSPVMYFLELLPRALSPGGGDCLVVGMGAGVVPRWYESQGVRVDVVDINPAVVRIARTLFGYEPGRPVAEADAREFLSRPGKAYDYLILDVFNGDTTPAHLLSVEAFELAKARLSARGVLALNIAGTLRHETLMTASLLRTLKASFANVECYPLFDPNAEPGWGNIVVLAYNFTPPAQRDYRAVPVAVHPEIYPFVARYLRDPYVLPAETPAQLLTDDDNPFDIRDLWLKEQARRQVLRHTEPELLL